MHSRVYSCICRNDVELDWCFINLKVTMVYHESPHKYACILSNIVNVDKVLTCLGFLRQECTGSLCHTFLSLWSFLTSLLAVIPFASFRWMICADYRRPAVRCQVWKSLETIYDLTYWGRVNIDAISQTKLSNAFSWIKMLEFRLIFHWSLFLRV